MKILYRNPWADQLKQQWEAFCEQSAKITPLLRQYGFKKESTNYFKIPNSDLWKFSTQFISAKRIIRVSYTSNLRQEGDVTFDIFPITKRTVEKGINIYKYLCKNFSSVSTKSLFLSRYQGDFSKRLYKVLKNYITFGEFYMHSILSGKYWIDEESANNSD